MELMDKWIHPHIQRALCLCLDDLPDDKDSRQNPKLSEPRDDGKYFRVGVFGSQVVQVVKWQDSSSPIEALLSDSCTTIRGHLSNDAVAKYRLERKTDVRANTRGALMKITDFEIVINKKKTPAPSLALYIRSFDILGCEGTGTFGNPRDISSFPAISALAGQCQSIRAESFLECTDMPRMQPQAPVSASDNESSHSSELSLASQADFATQLNNITTSKEPTRCKPLPMNSPTSLKSRDLLNLLVSNGRGRETTRDRNTPISVESPSTAKTNPDKGSMPRPIIPNSDISIRSATVPPNIPRCPQVVPSQQNVMCDKIHPPKAEPDKSSSSDISTKLRHKKDSKNPSPTPAIDSYHSSDRGPIKPKDRRSSASNAGGRQRETAIDDAKPWKNEKRIRRQDVSIPQAQQEILDSPNPWVGPETRSSLLSGQVSAELSDGRSEGSNETECKRHTGFDDPSPWKNTKRIGRQDMTIPQDQQHKLDSPSAWAGPVTDPSSPVGQLTKEADDKQAHMVRRQRKTNTDDADPWKGWKRIRRRDVFIPQDQEEILDSPNSWIPPPAGQSLPSGRVPIELLRQWNEAQTKSDEPKNTPASENRGSEGPEELDEQSTQPELVPSPAPATLSTQELGEDEWPLTSPPRLPPDSSPPRVLQRPNNPPITRKTQEKNEEDVIVDEVPALPDRQYFTNIRSSSFLMGVEPRSGEYSAHSDIEYSIPRGLETSTQEHQKRSFELTQEESMSSSGPQLSPCQVGSFTQVKQSPEIAHPHRQAPAKPKISTSRERQGSLPPDNVDSTSKLASETVIPATFPSTDIRREGQLADALDNSGREPSPPVSADDGDENDDRMTGRQLASELDGFILDISTQMETAGFDGAFSSLGTQKSTGNLPDTPCPNMGSTAVENDSKKRKLNSDNSLPLRSPKRRIMVSRTAHTQEGPSTSKKTAEDIPDISLRRNYFRKSSPFSAVEKIYLNFKRAYSAYDGDIHTFTNSCFKLQSLRSKGSLEKSVLWDDFVCREATQYRDYVQQCDKRNETPKPYEEYFLERVTVPSFKKRNLTGKSIDLVLAWHEGSQKECEVVDVEDAVDNRPGCTVEQRVGSFERGLQERNQMSSASDSERPGKRKKKKEEKTPHRKRHDSVSIPDSEEWRGYETHETASVQLGDTDDSKVLSGGQKQSSLEFNEVEMEEESIKSLADETTASPDDIDESNPRKRPGSPNDKVLPVLEMEEGASLGEIPGQRSRRELKGKQPQRLAAPSKALLGKTQSADESSMDEAFYTTDSFYPPYRPPKPRLHNSQTENTTAAEERPASPTSNWWRDPNTPFKFFAHAYSNLHTELGRFRRAGETEAVPVDENGVILPHRVFDSGDGPVEGRMTSMGWEV
ncbi:hypothetical protein D8B26_004343 [Coccidioides posadasii str. Silveira]|uniref:Shelterin complex subunit TPP1/Est3 domain-containing protein n=1 Tax=Coccidioides posadasii (strain RMSCC 757 / Silveira) TaxID=443226 RepID=E9DCC3_COCPS|nr:conserved hypothetical protein [Coccidioides posadasii str. Silveira]QVM09686.1 hypothetical protein D8B26_004343 [Coccidioides posadasii str. Silveira]